MLCSAVQARVDACALRVPRSERVSCRVDILKQAQFHAAHRRQVFSHRTELRHKSPLDHYLDEVRDHRGTAAAGFSTRRAVKLWWWARSDDDATVAPRCGDLCDDVPLFGLIESCTHAHTMTRNAIEGQMLVSFSSRSPEPALANSAIGLFCEAL